MKVSNNSSNLNIFVFQFLFRCITYILILLSLWYCTIFIISVIFRIQYPYELTWYEDENLYQVQRILAGQPLYSAPTLEYVPFVYGPVYYYISTLWASLLGLHLYILRLVSIISTLGTAGLIFLFLYKDTKLKSAAIVGVGFFFATYPLSKYSFDVGRVDALFLFFLCCSFYLTRFGNSKKSHATAAITIMAAVFIKQIALIMAVLFCLYYLIENKKYLGIFISTLIATFLFGLLIMFFLSSGWYIYYTFMLTYSHIIHIPYLFSFWFYDLMFKVPIALFASFFILYSIFKSRLFQKRVLIYIFVSLGIISLISRAREGGDINVLSPMFVVLAICFGLFYQYLQQKNIQKQSTHLFYSVYFSLFLAAQLLFLIYNPFKAIPSKKDSIQINKLIKLIEQTNGEVYSINHRTLLLRYKKQRYAHLHAFKEIVGYYSNQKPTTEGAKLANEMKHKFNNKRFKLIILDTYVAYYEKYNPFKKEIDANYKIISKLLIPVEDITYIIYVPK